MSRKSIHHNSLVSNLGIAWSAAAAVCLITLSGAVGMAQPPKTLAVFNAAGSATVVAPGSLASAFGKQIGASTEAATILPLTTTLGGVRVSVMDSAKASRLALLFYVSPNQINFVVPDGTAAGMATVTILNGDATPPSTTVLVATVAPGLFTANSQGTGVAAALAIRRVIATQTDTEVPVFHCDANACGSDPIDLDAASNVFLELFGTGIRGRTALAKVSATIGGTTVDVLFAGAQGQFPGLDQVNLMLPLTLKAKGETEVVLIVDGQVANKVRVNIH
jgi:uncharacterized protein (TIGR03437 family)